MKLKGTLYIIAAPSGGGKTSLVRALVTQLPRLVISISHTTRPARPAEKNGVNYHFVSEAEFQNLLKSDTFLEHANVFGYCYGTSKKLVQESLAQGNDVILEIDWQGAQQIRQQFPDAVGIFIMPPSLDVLRERLRERAQDSEQVIEHRMQQAEAEMSHANEFDYLIINNDFELAVMDLMSIIHSQRLRNVEE